MSRLEAGVAAPDFVLNNFKGKIVDLKSFRDKKNILLVFNRGFL